MSKQRRFRLSAYMLAGRRKEVPIVNVNCPNCGAPLTGCRCEYCGTVDASAEKRMRVEIDNLMFADQIRRSVNHFISAGFRPTPPSLPTKKER